MKTNPIATRALAGMLPAMALFATPAFAQDAAQPVPPATPPVVEAAPQATPPAAAEGAPANGPSADDRAKFEASAAAATGTATAAETTAAPAARRAAARPAPGQIQRAAPGATAPAAPVLATAPAPAAPAPAATAPAPVATAQSDAPMTTPIPEETTPATATTTDMVTDTTATTGGVPLWGWIVGALALLAVAAAAVFALRRRREENVWTDDTVAVESAYQQPAYVEPVAAAPLASETVAEDHAEVVVPAADEVAAITAASAPVTGRPWIELSLRPLRAGTTEDTAVVDLELTLANAGEVVARNVRVSTFMLGDGSDAPTDLELLLATGRDATQVSTGDLGAGEGSRVDASLVVPREGLDGATFQPIVVADVRYTLPDGAEGRTAAAFAVGVDDGTDDPTPLRLGGDIREDVSATLYGVPERA